MKLGIKEIGAVVALATAGCGQEPEAVQTAPEALALRDACNREARRVATDYITAGVGLGSIVDSAVKDVKKLCLAKAGLE